MRVLLLTVLTAGIVAISGLPQRAAGQTVFATVRHVLIDHPNTANNRPEPAAQTEAGWTECGSLVLLATGMFGAAFVVRRRQP